MRNSAIIEKLADYCIDVLKVTWCNNREVMIEDSDKMLRRDFIDQHFNSAGIKKADAFEFYDLPREQQDQVMKDLFYVLRQEFEAETKEKYNLHGLDIENNEGFRDGLVPLVDVRTGNIFLYNKKIRQISEMHYKAYEKGLSYAEKKYLSDNLLDVLVSYDPYVLQPLIPVEWEGSMITQVNTYSPPSWRLKEDTGTEPDERIWELLEHLFPDDKTLDYVLNWMYHALVLRNEVYLVLNGPKGVGKGVFCSLLAALVGRVHYTEAPKNFLDSGFNAVLDKKRLIVLDEVRVGKKQHTTLKRYINKYQAIEKKGVDADKTSETYHSYVISNNEVSDMYLETDDRRFFVADLTTSPLLDIWTPKEIQDFAQALEREDDELIRPFGFWLYNHGKGENLGQFSFFKGKRFWECCYTGLTDWKKFIVDKVKSCESESYSVIDLQKEYRRENNFSGAKYFPKDYQRIRDFLNNYLVNGVYRLGDLTKVDGLMSLVPSDTYMPEESEQDGEDMEGSGLF